MNATDLTTSLDCLLNYNHYDVICHVINVYIYRKLAPAPPPPLKILDPPLIVVEHQVDGTRLLIYVYIYLNIDVFFCHTCIIVRCLPVYILFDCTLNLLSFIVTMYWTEFQYSNSHVLVYVILRVTFFHFFVNNWLS